MKYFLLLFLIPFHLNAKTPAYPQVQTVVDVLFKKYDVPVSVNERSLHFAKKPEGWVMQWVDKTKVPALVLEEEIFWSAKKTKYEKLSLPAVGMSAVPLGGKIEIAYSDKYNYSRCLYYGYIGWDRDIIREIGAKKNINDTALEGLGRAYSNYAAGFTDHSYGFHLSFYQLDEQMRLDSFIRYSELEIGVYRKLKIQNPDYEVMVGNAATKYANSIMALYDYLLLHGKEKRAEPYMQEELYDGIILTAAKSYLASCDSNAILFTWGDNDTYPLEYLQFFKGFRTDVTLLNLSLLNLHSILEQAAKGKGKSLPVKFLFDMNEYAKDETSYFKMENIDQGIITYPDFLSKMYAECDGQPDCYSYNFPECTIQFPNAAASFKEIKGAVADSLAFIAIPSGSYYRRGDFAQLDILLSNVGTRPVYYTLSGEGSQLGIKDYLFSEGMVLHFIPLKMKDGNEKLLFGTNTIAESSYANMMEIQLSDSTGIDKFSGDRFVTNFRIQYYLLAYHLTSEEPEKAIRLLDHCDSLFPPSQWKYEPVCAYAVQAYYESGQKGKGDRLALQMMETFEQSLKNKKTPPDESERMQMYLAAKLIKVTAETFSRGQIIFLADQLLEELK
ncbi:MAG: hypothetical protein M3R17_04625 [Bacteroidota bacterium]|nr:hypothetical protein [Bacteroidota bacterium]